MKQNNKLGFTLVELLVVITILAIISVVAYQNFGGAVDKAIGGRKISDVSTIETSLQQYKSDNNYYPVTNSSSNSNMWGYDSTKTASPSNTIQVTYAGETIASIVSANGGGRVYGTGSWASGVTKRQIGAKGTISMATLGKKYLSKDLYDPEVGDIKVGTAKLIDSGIGRYVYATFKKNPGDGDWASDYRGNAYNIAYTVKENNGDYVSKVVGDYDEEACYDDKATCPKTLIGSGSEIIVDGDKLNGLSTSTNYHIPYAVSDFAAAP